MKKKKDWPAIIWIIIFTVSYSALPVLIIGCVVGVL